MKHFLVFIKGLLIGIANVIPGVSGGTFALVLGIYDRLIAALRSLDVKALRVAVSSVIKLHQPAARAALMEEVRRTDLVFVGVLGAGALLAIKGLAGVLQWLLTYHPTLTLAYFIGLIVPSIAVPMKMMDRRGGVEAVTCCLGVGLTLLVSMGTVSTGGAQPALWIVFLGGAAAIAAMILPGISGSFVLLVLGLYQATLENIHHITGHSFVFLGVMALGFLVGIVTISRVMAYLLVRHRSATLAFLIGLIVGSLYVLWPFKDFDLPPTPVPVASAPSSTQAAEGTSEGKEQKVSIRVATAPNRLPRSAGEAGWPLVMLVLGLGCSIGLNKLGSLRDRGETEAGEA